MIVILNRPQMAENVGFAARNMKNFGAARLRLVSPGLMKEDEWGAKENNEGFNLPSFLLKAEAVAKGGADIIKNATVYNSIEDACFDVNRIYALSARRRELAKEVITPESAIKEVLEFEGESAFLFGSEARGLSNLEANLAYKMVEIEASKEYSSINLGMSVGIISYAYFKALNGDEFKKSERGIRGLSDAASIKRMCTLLETKLTEAQYFKVPEKQEGMMINITNIFTKANLTGAEVKTLIGIFNLISKPKY